METLRSNQIKLKPLRTTGDYVLADELGNNFFGLGTIEQALTFRGQRFLYRGCTITIIEHDEMPGAVLPVVRVHSAPCKQCQAKVSTICHLETSWTLVQLRLKYEMWRHRCNYDRLVVDVLPPINVKPT